MGNFKYNDPALQRAYFKSSTVPEFGYDMAPRLMGPDDSYNNFEMGRSLVELDSDRAAMYPNPGGLEGAYSRDLPSPQDQFYGGYQDGQFRFREGSDRYAFGYDTLGSPMADPMLTSPGGTNEIFGAPQTDYTGGFDTSTSPNLNPITGPTMPPEFRTQSEIGAPVVGTPTPKVAADSSVPPVPKVAADAASTAASTDTSTSAKQGGGGGGAGQYLGSVGQIAGGVANIIQGYNTLGDVDIQGAENAVAALKNNRPGLGTPTEFFQMQKEAYDQRLMAMRTEDINRGLATNVAAAQQYGARGLGSTLAATAQAQRAQQQEVLQQQRFQTQALGSLAAARERETQRREDRSRFDIGLAYDELKAEQAREAYARQQITQGFIGVGTGIASAAMTGGMAEKGAKVTPGEFSHDNNPIDIVQEGTKIGEMTGGEYIFNPQQANKMMNEASKGNSPLHKFVRKTLNRFHKDAAKQ